MKSWRKSFWVYATIIVAAAGFLLEMALDGVVIKLMHEPLSRFYTKSYIFNSRRKASAELKKELTHTKLQVYLSDPRYKWMRDQVAEDLAHHPELSGPDVEVAFIRNNIPNNKLVRIRIKDNDIYVREPFDLFIKSWTKIDRGLVVLLNVLEDMCAKRLLPDVDFVLSLQDRPEKTASSGELTYPIFAFSKNVEDSYEKGLILFPDYENIIIGRKGVPDLYKDHGDVEGFDTKKAQILFRGGDSDVTRFRHRLVEYAKDKDFVDAEIITHNQNRDKSMSVPQQVSYKYNISADGVTATWTRVVWLLATDTLLLKHKSPRLQWFYGAIKPGVHYVEVGDNLDELRGVFDHLEQNPEEAKTIVKNGRAFYHDHLNMHAIYGYIYVLLNAYHHKQKASGGEIKLDKNDKHYGLWKRGALMTQPRMIYKILTQEEWAEFQRTGLFAGSELDRKDGFLHMSYKDQIARTHKKFFAEREGVLLIHVDPEKLDRGSLKPEANKPGGDVYPHIYGKIPLVAVTKTEKLG